MSSITWSPIMAFAMLALAFTIGDYVSSKTKGIIASILTVDILFLIFGGILHILPPDLVQINFMVQITGAIGLALVLTNLGSTFKLSDFVREWRTVLVALGATAGCVIACMTLGSVLFGREMAYACAAPLAGGTVAGTISTEAVMAAGREDLALYVSGVIGFQILLGAPIGSFCLYKEARRYMSKGEYKLAAAAMAEAAEKKPPIRLPAFFDCPNAHFARLALLAGIGGVLSSVTGIPAAVVYLLIGVVGAMTGLLDKDCLAKAGGKNLLTLALFALICQSWLTTSLEQFLSILVPMFVYMAIGVAGALLLGLIIGKLVGWSVWMSSAISMCIILAYPTNYVVTTEIIKMAVKDKGYTDEQVESLNKHLMTKILMGSIVAVTIASAVIASYIAPHIFG